MHFETVVDGRPYYNSTQTTTVDHQFVHRTSHPGGGSHHVVVTSTSSSGLKAKAFLSRSAFIGKNTIGFLSTTLQSMMNAKPSLHGFWHCNENGLFKMIQTIIHNLYVSFKLASLYCGLRLILVYPNP